METLDKLDQPSLYLVVDALDECQVGHRELLDLIASISGESRIKWIVSSRNEPEIEERLSTAKQRVPLSLELNAESVSNAVHLYIEMKSRKLGEEKGYDQSTSAQVATYLFANAQDTFLWVALVCQALEKVHRSKARKTLRSFPAGLNALYARMMEQVCGMEDTDDVDICRQILAVAATVYRPITLGELESFIDCPKHTQHDIHWLDYYIELCASFLALRDSTIQFVHQSAKDFLCGPSLATKSPGVFPRGIAAVHHLLFSESLRLLSQTLCRDIYRLSHPGIPIEDVTAPTPDPLARARYSCAYWVEHLIDSHMRNTRLDDLRDRGITHEFLRQKFLHWLEALSLMRALPKGVLAMNKLHIFFQSNHDSSQLSCLVRDMQRFILSHRSVIEIAPLQTYVSALVFSPCKSLTRQLYQREEPGLIKTSIAEEAWDACLTTLEGDGYSVNSVAFSPNGQQLASACSDRTIKLWDAATGTYLATLRGHNHCVDYVAFSHYGQLASASRDKTIKLWDIAKGTCLMTLEDHGAEITSIAFSPNSQQLASASTDIKLWDVTAGTCLWILDVYGKSPPSMAFSPNGQQLALGCSDKIIRLLDVSTGTVQCLATRDGHTHSINSVVFSPNGQQLVSASLDSSIKFWDITTGSYPATVDFHSSTVTFIAFSPNGQQLASAATDIKLWDASIGTCLATLQGHRGNVACIAFSPNGQHLASGSWNEAIKLWNIATGICFATIEDRLATSIAFSPNCQQLASSRFDKTINLWDIATGTCLQTIFTKKTLRHVSFNSTGTSLDTAMGPIGLGQLVSTDEKSTQNISKGSYGINRDNTWITYRGRNQLWLPSGYRPYAPIGLRDTFAINGSTISIGCRSGRVWFLWLSMDIADGA